MNLLIGRQEEGERRFRGRGRGRKEGKHKWLGVEEREGEEYGVGGKRGVKKKVPELMVLS